MRDNGTEAGPDTLPTFGADEWLGRLADLPLVVQPGEGWRYHHSFAVLGILLARVTGDLGKHLEADLFGPLGMTDTGLWVPDDKLDRLPAAYRFTATTGWTRWSRPVAGSTRGSRRSTSATASWSPRCATTPGS